MFSDVFLGLYFQITPSTTRTLCSHWDLFLLPLFTTQISQVQENWHLVPHLLAVANDTHHISWNNMDIIGSCKRHPLHQLESKRFERALRKHGSFKICRLGVYKA